MPAPRRRTADHGAPQCALGLGALSAFLFYGNMSGFTKEAGFVGEFSACRPAPPPSRRRSPAPVTVGVPSTLGWGVFMGLSAICFAIAPDDKSKAE